MGESSYEKIYKAIEQTLECRALIEVVGKRIETTHVSSVEFSLSRGTRSDDTELCKPATAQPKFSVTAEFINRPGCFKVTDSYDGVYLSINQFVMDDEIKGIVDATFGTKVKTYYCSKGVLTGEKYKSGVNSFRDHIRNVLHTRYANILAETKYRIEAEVHTEQCSEENHAKAQAFLAECAIKDIKRVLSSYAHLGKNVLKAALDEFIVHEICAD